MDNPRIIWMTGLSGSGKSTLAKALQTRLNSHKIPSFILDGDALRKGLNSDLDFTPYARKENMRRVKEVSKLFVEAGISPIVALISPYREDRNSLRHDLKDYGFIEVYVKCSIEACEKRDPKGLYKMARGGSITNFTGVSDTYECPLDPELVLDTECKDLIACLDNLWTYLCLEVNSNGSITNNPGSLISY